MQWKKPSEELPPQGKKILYLSKGDCYVVQRMGKYWLPIPFYDSKFAFHDEPELWADIEMPGMLTGKVHFLCADEDHEDMLDLDELEMQENCIYKELLDAQLKLWGIDE